MGASGARLAEAGQARHRPGRRNVRRHRKPSVTAARFLVSFVMVGSGLLAVATVVASSATPFAGAQTTQTTTYAPTPTTAPATTAPTEPTTTVAQPLPHTGTNTEASLMAGAIAIAVGGLIVLGVRARRHRTGVS
jgi:LPXTG-motif cell wall-anchored protein